MSFLQDLGAAIAIGASDRAAGRATLAEMWRNLDSDDRAGRLILAHYLADLQEDVDDEVRWDQVALANAENVSDAELQMLHPTLTVLGFIPSLQLNLADGYRRQGRMDAAALALQASVAQNGALPVDRSEQVAYRESLLRGQALVGDLLAAGDSTSPGLRI